MILEHFKHENVTSVIFNTAERKFDYLEYDDAYALGVKCVWALFKIGSATAIEKLHILAKSRNLIIRKRASQLVTEINQ